MRPPSQNARQNLIRILTRQMRERKNKPRPAKEAAKLKKRWNIVRGDRVQVIGDHPERGKQGIVKEVLRKIDRVIVEGVNVKNRTVKGNKDRGIKGRIVQMERSLPYPAVALLDPEKNVPTRIVRKFLEDGTKVRVSVKSGAIIPKPDILKHRKRPIRSTETDRCTDEADAWEVTYEPPPWAVEKETPAEELVKDMETD